MPQNTDTIVQFDRATRNLQTTWDDLVVRAKAAGRIEVPQEYKANVELAVKLLRQGLDPTVTAAERRDYVQRAMSVASKAIDAGVLPIPDKALVAIEAKQVSQLPR